MPFGWLADAVMNDMSEYLDIMLFQRVENIGTKIMVFLKNKEKNEKNDFFL